MNKNKVLVALAVIFISSQAYATTIKTFSSRYASEAGATIYDTDLNGSIIEGSAVKKTRKTVGGLFSAMGEDGQYNWAVTKGKVDQYGDKGSGVGIVNYKRTSNSLLFDGQADYIDIESRFVHANGFLQSEFDWRFKIESGDATLTHAFIVNGGEKGSSSLYDETAQKWIFDSGELGRWDQITGSFTLKSNHQYQYSHSFTSYGQNLNGFADMRFENATMELPSPAPIGLLGFALLGLFILKKRRN